MYANGQGVAQDYVEAAKWWRIAADQRDAYAECNLGLLYLSGHGVPQNYAAGVRWLRKAADRGYAEAQYNLGAAYRNGVGVTRDYVEAHKWYNLAAASATDADTRNAAAKERDALAAKMNPASIAEAQKRAEQWSPSWLDKNDEGGSTAQKLTSSGSGFAISPSGLIATSQHVVEAAHRITVTLPTGSEVEATVSGPVRLRIWPF